MDGEEGGGRGGGQGGRHGTVCVCGGGGGGLTVGVDGGGLAPLPESSRGTQLPASDVDVPLLPVEPLLLLAEPGLLVALLEELEGDLGGPARVPLHPVQDVVHLLVDDALHVAVDALDVRDVEELEVDLARADESEGPVEEDRVKDAAKDVLDLGWWRWRRRREVSKESAMVRVRGRACLSWEGNGGRTWCGCSTSSDGKLTTSQFMLPSPCLSFRERARALTLEAMVSRGLPPPSHPKWWESLMRKLESFTEKMRSLNQ